MTRRARAKSECAPRNGLLHSAPGLAPPKCQGLHRGRLRERRSALRAAPGWRKPRQMEHSGRSRLLQRSRERLVRTLQLIPPRLVLKASSRSDATCRSLRCWPNPLIFAGARMPFGESGYITPVIPMSSDGETFECTIDLFDAETDPFLIRSFVQHGSVWRGSGNTRTRSRPHDDGIHRILKPEGILVLTTPNIVSQRAVANVLKGTHPASFNRYTRPQPGGIHPPGHSREYTPDEIRLLLSDCGFIPLRIETGSYSAAAESHPAIDE